MNDKITPAHLQRKAMLYIRQSSPHQVVHNQESRRLQYAMKERLQLLGWSDIETIDEDLGRSASGQVARSGAGSLFPDSIAHPRSGSALRRLCWWAGFGHRFAIASDSNFRRQAKPDRRPMPLTISARFDGVCEWREECCGAV